MWPLGEDQEVDQAVEGEEVIEIEEDQLIVDQAQEVEQEEIGELADQDQDLTLDVEHQEAEMDHLVEEKAMVPAETTGKEVSLPKRYSFLECQSFIF